MINKIFLPFISAIIIILLISCNDSPTDLGTGFLGQDGVEVLKLDSSTDSIPQFSKPVKKVFSLGSSARLLLGKSDNVKASTLLHFIFSFDTTITGQIKRNELTVLDSWIELVKDYSFGDSSAAFNYTVHKITSNWTSSGFTVDSLEFLMRESNDVSSFKETNNDTLYTFHLETDVISSWLHHYADTSIGFNYGLLLSPTDDTQKVLGFTAYNSSEEDEPLLKIIIKNTDNEIDTVLGYIASDISVVEGEIASVGDENLAIQSSLTSEAKLFFDLSIIPDSTDINYASLTLTVDTLQTKNRKQFY